MNAHIGDKSLLERTDYIFEPKLDGIRALCYVNKTMRFVSRNNKELDYPELHQRSAIKAKQAILDGEVIAFDQHGVPSFNALQLGGTPYYAVFDILMKDNEVLVNKPIEERKKILHKTVKQTTHINLIPFTDDGKKMWREIKKKQLEGVMAKLKGSRYYPGIRSYVWLKIKERNTIDCIIIGYTKEKRAVSSLALALYDDKKKLRYIGKTGTGFSQETIDMLAAKFKKLKKIENPFADLKVRGIIWIEPKLVAEIKYVQITPYGMLRISAFVRLRPDKKPEECTVKEQLR